MRIPHFTSFWQPIEIDNFNSTDSFTRNLFPHPKKYSEALLEVVKSFRWINFAIIYDAEDNLSKLQDTFSLYSTLDIRGKQAVTFYKLPADSDDYKPILKAISKAGFNRIMIDCTLERTYSVLSQSTAVGMMSEYVVRFEF